MNLWLPVIPIRNVSQVLVATAAALLLLAPASYATPITLVVSLSGGNEIPVVPSPATGQATILLDPAAHTLQLNVTFSGLVAPDTAAHIHCCLPFPGALINIPVATTLPAFPLFPLGVTSGSYSSQVFDLTQALIYNPAFVMTQGGIPQAEAALVAGLLNVETYLNIHTSNVPPFQGFPGGEIRGFVLQAVPEPASLVLVGSSLLGVRLLRRRSSSQRTWRRR